MTTQVTPGTEVEATPTPEIATPEDFGDELLIPQEVAEEQGQDVQEVAAADADEGATEEVEAVETPAQTIKREEHEAELAKVRSGLDKRIAELTKTSKETTDALERRAAEAEQQLQAQQLEVQTAQWQRQQAAQELQARDFANMSVEDIASYIAAEKARFVRAAYEENQKATMLQAQLDKASAAEKSLGARQAAIDMAAEHGVSDEQMPLLMTARSPQEMASLAKEFGALNKAKTELAALKQAQVPAGGEANKVDSGGGNAAGKTDEQKLNDLNTPLAEIEEILARRGEHPFR